MADQEVERGVFKDGSSGRLYRLHPVCRRPRDGKYFQATRDNIEKRGWEVVHLKSYVDGQGSQKPNAVKAKFIDAMTAQQGDMIAQSSRAETERVFEAPAAPEAPSNLASPVPGAPLADEAPAAPKPAAIPVLEPPAPGETPGPVPQVLVGPPLQTMDLGLLSHKDLDALCEQRFRMKAPGGVQRDKERKVAWMLAEEAQRQAVAAEAVTGG